jgi:hypothetical protein
MQKEKMKAFEGITFTKEKPSEKIKIDNFCEEKSESGKLGFLSEKTKNIFGRA